MFKLLLIPITLFLVGCGSVRYGVGVSVYHGSYQHRSGLHYTYFFDDHGGHVHEFKSTYEYDGTWGHRPHGHTAPTPFVPDPKDEDPEEKPKPRRRRRGWTRHGHHSEQDQHGHGSRTHPGRGRGLQPDHPGRGKP